MACRVLDARVEENSPCGGQGLCEWWTYTRANHIVHLRESEVAGGCKDICPITSRRPKCFTEIAKSMCDYRSRRLGTTTSLVSTCCHRSHLLIPYLYDFIGPLDNHANAEVFKAAIQRGKDPGRKKREQKKHIYTQQNQPLVEWETEKIKNRTNIIRHHLLYLKAGRDKAEIIDCILGNIATDRQMCLIPLQHPIFDTIQGSLADWLLTLILEPTSTSPPISQPRSQRTREPRRWRQGRCRSTSASAENFWWPRMQQI